VKFSRFVVVSLAAAALLGAMGCGNSSDPTSANPNLDSNAPPTPAGLQLVSVPEYNELAWEASTAPDVARYQVYEYQPDPSRDNAYVMIGETTTASYRLPFDDGGTETFYRVRAVDESGNRSAMSDAFTADVPVITRGGGGGGGTEDGGDGRIRIDD
jgi:hypothetical protein